jgi:radical SAM/Cys-rich protein
MAFLPPAQKALEDDYRKALSTLGISFDELYTFANMPIGRFRDFLLRTNNLDKYMETLVNSFNPSTIDGLMCGYLVSVGWDGMLYDCDFNQILGLVVKKDCPQHIKDFDSKHLAGREIVVGEYCYGCTAGQGST